MTLTFSSMGTANINNGKYLNDIRANMKNDVDTYNTANPTGDFEKTIDAIYQDVSAISWKRQSMLITKT